MKRKQNNSRLELIRMITVSALLTGSAWAAEPVTTLQTQSSGRGIAATDLNRYQRETNNDYLSTGSLQTATQGQVDLVYANCREINQIGQQLGMAGSHTPCRDTGLNTNTNYLGSQGDEPQDDTSEELIYEGTADVVLLIHGFSLYSESNCAEYWQAQKNALIKRDQDNQLQRDILTVQYYSETDGTCDVDLTGDNNFTHNTPLKNVSDALFEYLQANHNGSYIDIVAHSMGGIVARKMIDDWGQQLLVRNVITLGTPHGGARAAFYLGTCLLMKQCDEMSDGSDFISALEHNPQSVVPTQWTLIAAAYDQVVGSETGLEMYDGNTGGPTVNKYTFELNHRHSCWNMTQTIGHADLHGHAAAWDVYDCTSQFTHNGTVNNPHSYIMDAIP